MGLTPVAEKYSQGPRAGRRVVLKRAPRPLLGMAHKGLTPVAGKCSQGSRVSRWEVLTRASCTPFAGKGSQSSTQIAVNSSLISKHIGTTSFKKRQGLLGNRRRGVRIVFQII